jgi:predicted porin
MYALAKIGLAVAGLVLPAAATADIDVDIDVYGRLNLTLQNSDDAVEEKVELQNNASRVGVKGEHDLKEGLKVVYQLEWGVDLDDEVDGTFTDRNQFVGLEGSLGTVMVGRHDTALKQAQGHFDLFDDLEGDISKVFNGENRLNDYIGYVTPTFAGALSGTLNFFPGEDPDTGNDGAVDAVSMSLKYVTDAVYAAFAHDRDVDGENFETTRLVGGYTVGPAQVMLLYQLADAGGVDEDGFGASVAWTFGDNVAKLQYLAADIWRIDPQPDPLANRLEDLLSVGLDHKLGESTRLFGFYTTGDIGGTSERNDYVAIGIEHNF